MAAPAVNGLQIIDEGSGGDPVVFLHGLCGDKETWRAQVDHLKTSRRVVAYDQRGHGTSARAANYSIQLLADDLENLTRELRLNKFWLVGHSMSGAVLSAYAAKHGDKLAGIIYVDAIGDLSNASPALRKWFMDNEGVDLPKMREAFTGMLGPKAKPQTREAVFAGLERCDRNAYVQLREDLVAQPAPRLDKVAVKAAIEADASDNPFFASHLPGVKRIEIKGVSHWLMLDDPAALNAALDEVLAWTK